MRRLNDLHGRFAAPKGARFQSLSSGGRSRSGDEGQTLIELALALPLLMMMLTGIFAFSVAFYNKMLLESAADAGARYLQTIRQSTTDPCADTLTAMENAAPSLNSANISLTLTMNGTITSGSACGGDQSDLIPNQPVTITATYPCSLPIFGSSIGSSCQLTAQVTEYEY